MRVSFRKFVNYLCQSAVSKSNTAKWCCKTSMFLTNNGLNPIERLWAAMKYYIRRRVKPTEKEGLTQGIREFWSTVTPVMCARYINRMMMKLPILPCINYSLVCDLPIHTRSSANAEGPRAHCPLKLKSCKMLHKCPMDCIWKGLQPANDFQCHSNDLQGHSRSLPLLPLDRPYTIFY